MSDPNGKVIMISGASRGIGREIAATLYRDGYTLSLGVRKPEELDTAEWEAARVAVYRFDAEDRGTHRAWVDGSAERFGRIDGLVNNAGIGSPLTIETYDEDRFDRLWAINVKAPLSLTNLALPHLRKSGRGRVVNIASLSGKRVRNDNVAYAMSKFAVVALTHGTRRIAWDDGVRATVICPGFVRTDATAGVTKVSREQMIDPADVARLVATVLSLPNTAVVAELLVNCQQEDML